MSDFESNLNTKNNDLILISNVEAIKTSIKNICTLKKKSLSIDPDMGIDLETVLFEVLDEVTYSYAEEMIVNELEKREPRIETQYVTFLENRDLGQLLITVVFKILSNSAIENTTIKIDIG